MLHRLLVCCTVVFSIVSVASSFANGVSQNDVFQSEKTIPEIVAFNASSFSLAGPNTPVTLSWQVEKATRIRLMDDAWGTLQDDLSSEGSTTFTPGVGQRYWLVAYGEGGQASRAVEIKVAVSDSNAHALWPTSQSIDSLQSRVSTSLTTAEDGSSYLGDLSGNYYKFSANGQLLWKHPIGVVMQQGLLVGDYLILGVSDGASENSERDSGSDFAPSSAKGKVLVLDTETGGIKAQYATRGAVLAQPIWDASHEIVYAADFNGVIYGLQLQVSGSVVRLIHAREYQLEQWGEQSNAIVSAPTLMDDILYVSTRDGTLIPVSMRFDGVRHAERIEAVSPSSKDQNPSQKATDNAPSREFELWRRKLGGEGEK
ncbi:hypothetical protein [Marinibactrum halimedae]|uniref:Uncharacterized protein n=1 Tax=Marinibactrum halimedae TaxID=1444977 RepID=A0AA37T3T8_9GAMM|nr:hypothetical protein [Marinibactrum halimedae]MCD9458597.1 hypothetical protein [Marinibactrum halimedae]GLS26534.1 hypothetical protein GCM10007877_22500 [Marinibactrum halimedae]